jgi:THO complex subunit 2
MATPRAVVESLHGHVFSGAGEAEAVLAKHASDETLVDALWTVSLEAECAADEDPDAWERMVQLVKVCKEKEVVPVEVLVARLEPSLLESAAVIAPGVFKKRLLKMNTTQMYVQVKFNLMHESHEGYSKLAVFLASLASEEGASGDAVATVEALIGRFRLDPNRVLDAVLEAYEQQCQPGGARSADAVFSRLLGLFRHANFAHTLGFKLQQLHKREVRTPPSLLRLVGRMVGTGELSLDAIWPHLSPSDKELASQQRECAAAVVARAKRLGKVSLGSSSVAKDGEEPAHPAAAAVAAVAAGRAANGLNQKFGLVAALLDADGWDAAERVMSRLAALGISAADDDAVAQALMDLLARRTEKLYRAIAPSLRASEARPAAEAADESPLACRAKGTLCGEMWKQLQWLRHRVARSPACFARVARLLVHIYGEKSVQLVLKMPGRGQKAALLQIVAHCLLPALSAAEEASGVLRDDEASARSAPAFFAADQVWLLLGKMPFQERYAAYERWRAEAYGAGAHWELALSQFDARSRTKALLKRCSKDNVRRQGRLLAAVAHSNPLIVCESIVALVESYENMIEAVVGCLKYFSSLSFDVLSFVMVKALSSERSKINLRDGINASHWLDSLAKFCGAVYRKHFSIELQGVLAFVVQRLAKNESLDIVILAQLLSAMTGVRTSDPTVCGEAELEAQAGGLHLQMEASVLLKRSRSKASPHSADALRKAMVKAKAIMPLLVLVARQSPSILYGASHMDALPVKVMGSQADACTQLLTQLVQFLSEKRKEPLVPIAPEAYVSLLGLPPLGDLVSVYGVPPAIAFHISRPALRASITRAPSRAGKGAKEEEKGRDASAVDAAAALLAPWAHDSAELRAAVRAVLPDAAWSSMTPALYQAFWSYSLYDLKVPKERYQHQMKRALATVERLKKPLPKEEDTTEGRRERRAELKAAQVAYPAVKEELAAQNRNHAFVMERFEAAKDAFFPPGAAAAEEKTGASSLALLRHCVLPRIMLSPGDALYCARFVALLHANDTPGFSTIAYYNAALKTAITMCICLSEREAAHLGIFLCETLRLLHEWSKLRASDFKKRCSNKRGFAMSSSTAAAGGKARKGKGAESASGKVGFETFAAVHAAWMATIGHVALRVLGTSECVACFRFRARSSSSSSSFSLCPLFLLLSFLMFSCFGFTRVSSLFDAHLLACFRLLPVCPSSPP